MLIRFLLIFIGLFILTLPFEQPLLPYLIGILALPFEFLSSKVGFYLLGFDAVTKYNIASDSIGLYISFLLFALISSSIALIWTILYNKISKREGLILEHLSAFYLSMLLFSYGFGKIFQTQFYSPEANILFTPLGNLDKDIVFWTSMSSSGIYNYFLGMMEIVPAILLVFKRTRFIGALIAFGVMLNVFFINIGFDISVKVLSAFLLLLSGILIFPSLYNLLLTELKLKPSLEEVTQKGLNTKAIPLKFEFLILLFFIVNASIPFLKSSFRADNSEKNQLQAAYEIDLFAINNDTLLPLSTDSIRWKRIFIHSQGYFIVQNMQDKMYDFELKISENADFIELIDYKQKDRRDGLNIEIAKQRIKLFGNFRGQKLYLEARKIDSEQLPFRKDNFHWIVK